MEAPVTPSWLAAWRSGDDRGGVLLYDVAPAVAMTAFLLVITPLAFSGNGGHDAPLDFGAYALCFVAGASFLVRRRLPIVTFAIALACTVLFVTLYDGGPIFVASIVAMIGLVSNSPRRVWIPASLIGVAALMAAQIARDGLSFAVLVIALVWVGAAIAWGEIARLRRAEMDEIRARAELAERSREDEALRRVVEERLRIAREVHDVVGHSLATITLQAGVVDHLLDTDPAEARKAVAAIRQVSKQALDELRFEIGALREGPNGVPLRPTPGLDALPKLVESMRAAGLPIELAIERNGARTMPETVQAASYRIVQEALTNVVRHAGPGVNARVGIVERVGAIEVEVVDDGAGPAVESSEGNGLAGMRERAAALGGSFEAGGGPQGGFRVHATLPDGPPR